ncbi:unnamed protein product [Vicia faba]|uniref:Uncharacterized protein n=1 Tax=Vicia faba TaxID=3906 RepID=A0AAV0YPA4_VICFA|nr:unnamed protein product [Vicia faba]
MPRYDERKFMRENGRRETEFGIRRKKKLERVKEEVVRIRKEKKILIVVTDEGVVSKGKKEMEEEYIFISKGNGRVVLYAELVKGIDLDFGLAYNTCLGEYEEENESQGTEPICEFEDMPLVDNIINHLDTECS